MLHLKRRLARDLYLPELQELVDFGQPVEARGRKFVELLDYCSEIEEPWHHCILVPSRRWNPWLALSEALWILAGRNDVAALKPYNSRIDEFSDDGVTLYGAYGARIYNQIDPIIERLRKDPNDRRAVLQIWDNHHWPDDIAGEFNDLEAKTKDPPCNNMVYFKLRDNKLHMTVICRSNDIHWGLFAVNIPTFGILQEYIAARLGVDIGHQTHVSNSLHVYTDNKQATEITDRMLYRESEDLPKYPMPTRLFVPRDFPEGITHKEFAQTCSAILDGEDFRSYWPDKSWHPPFFRFSQEFLKYYRDRQMPQAWSGFADWWLAGKIFSDRVWKKNGS